MTWLYTPCLYAAEAGDSTSPLPESLARSVTSRGKLMPPRFWLRVSKTADWPRLLSGLTYSPSMVNRGVEWWISFMRASRASPSATQASAAAPTTSDGSGLMLRESFATWDQSGCSWKTSQVSLPLDLEPSSLTWPRSGSMRSGRVFERPMPVRPTAGSDGSSWATALAGDERAGVSQGTVSLGRQVRLMDSWPTPDAAVMNDGEDPAKRLQRLQRLQAKHGNGNGAGRNLGSEVQLLPPDWPTPTGRDGRDGRDGRASMETMSRNARPLNEVVVMLWPTATAADANASGAAYPATATRAAGVTLTDAAVRGLLRPLTAKDGKPSSTNGRVLNPQFVEMLMGWEPGWTAFDSAVTGSCPSKLASPGRCSCSA